MRNPICEDRGVRHTKLRIYNAFIELLSKKPVYKITVKELVELADINRGTFYFHYSDIYHLLEELESNLYKAYDVIMKQPYTSAPQLLISLLEVSYNNSQLISLLLGSNGDPRFINTLSGKLKANLLSLWENQRIDISSQKVQMYSTFLVQGLIGMTIEWLTHNPQLSPNEIADYYAKTIQSSYHEFIDSL